MDSLWINLRDGGLAIAAMGFRGAHHDCREAPMKDDRERVLPRYSQVEPARNKPNRRLRQWILTGKGRSVLVLKSYRRARAKIMM